MCTVRLCMAAIVFATLGSSQLLAVEPLLYPCRDECFQPGDCSIRCKDGAAQSTCAMWFNKQAGWDYDGDGVLYPQAGDNCPCVYNPDQANCDGDSQGDTCDPVDQRWDLVQDLGWCDTDFDSHFGYWSIELYGQKKYRDVCSGAICFDKYEIDEATCPIGGGSCNTSAANCCKCFYTATFCGASPGCGNNCPF